MDIKEDNQNKLIGLNNRENLVFSAIINSVNEISLSELEKITKLPKTTIHRMISSLVNKGLVVWQLGTQGKTVAKGNYATYIEQLKQKQTEIDSVITQLSQVNNDINVSINRPIIKYYEGVEGICQMIWNTLDSKSGLLVYTNIMRQDVIGKKWLVDYCMEFVQRDIKDRVLCDTSYAKDSYQRFGGRQKYFSPIEKFYQISQERVFKSPLMRIKGETYIYNDIFATYSLEGDLLVGCEIQSKDITDTQKSIFENLWAQTSDNDSIDNY